MERFEVNNFDIKLNKNNVLRSVGCLPESSAYEAASRYYDELLGMVTDSIDPYAAACNDGVYIYCLITIGDKISPLIEKLFADGEAMKGLLADAMADEYLFEADKLFAAEIRRYCAVNSLGVHARLDAPKDFPLSEQSVILSKTAPERVSLTEAFMLNPVKSIAFMLKLTNDTDIFNAQHDCAKCSAVNCPRRSRAYVGEFDILADYDFSPAGSSGSVVCIDIGTTTVAFEFIADGKRIASYKTTNPQRRFGHDVLSRIEAANRGRLSEMCSLIRYTLKKGFEAVTHGHGAPDKVIIAANTTMVHLLMNYSCAEMGEYPFNSGHLATIETTFDRVTSGGTASVPTIIVGGVSAFVGGDITSGLYMCGFDTSDKINMFIDLGTNGEMAIGRKNKIIATSAAAGPAFEGGLISCGMGSVSGAICSVALDPFLLKTIDDAPPEGLCGTGIIELMSEMKKFGIIDNTGLLKSEYFKNGFPITDSISFTQSDIRQVQMAKSAVRAGIECLVKEYGTDYDSIDTVYLAGGFGHGLSVEKACSIGILPPELEKKAKPVGNSSLGGCVKLYSNAEDISAIERIQSVSSEFLLGENKEFHELYMRYMNF